MANNGWVVSRYKKIKPEKISSILDDLNARLFKHNLLIDIHEGTFESPGWGLWSWMLRYVSGDQEYASRVCWLETTRKFVMRHGGGSDFAWWIDHAILNEVAWQFQSVIQDDADDIKSAPIANQYDNLQKYLEQKKSPCLRFQEYADGIPPEFLEELTLSEHIIELIPKKLS